MEQMPSIKKNYIMNILMNIAAVLFPLLTYPYVSRIFLPDGMGRISFAQSLVGYFNMFAQLGIPTYGIRAAAKVRDDKEKLSRTVQEILLLNLITCAISYIALFVCIMSVRRLADMRILCVIFSTTLLFNTIGMDWFYAALEQYSYISVRTVLLRTITVAGIFLLIHSTDDLLLYAGLCVFMTVMTGVINLVHARKFISFQFLGGYHPLRHLKPILMFFMMACAQVIYTNLDTVMLGFLSGERQVGYYSVAIKIRSTLFCVLSALVTVVYPRVSYDVERGDMEQFKKLGNHSIRYILITAAPLAVYFGIFAAVTVSVLCGPQFVPAEYSLRVVMPTVLFIGVSNVLTVQVLFPLGLEKKALWSTITGAVIDFLLNAALIPRLGAVGAGIGTLTAEFGVMVVLIIETRKYISFREVEYGKIAAAMAAAVLGSSLLTSLLNAAWTRLVVSGFTFFGIYLAILILLKESLCMELLTFVRDYIKKRIKK